MVFHSLSSVMNESLGSLKYRCRQCLLPYRRRNDILRIDKVNETVVVRIWQFSFASILSNDLLVMKTVHADFRQVQNRKIKKYQSVEENFVFHHSD